MNSHWNWRSLLLLSNGLMLLILAGIYYRWIGQPPSVLANPYDASCERLGWYPDDFGLKDHTIFSYDGFYYITAIRTPNESLFAYARSTNLCAWEYLGTVLDERIPGEWDETAIWAPFVREESGFYYMYYTGLRYDYTQSIMLATSTNPADPESWQRQGMIFQPNHEGMLWQAGSWADCRDASVLKVGGIYYMLYTGRDIAGPIVGLATSFLPAGPWYDWGAVLTLPQPEAMAESPTVVSHEGIFYLLYNNSYLGEEYRIGPTLAGPWSDDYPFPPGWANEVWVGQDGLDYTSFIQSYDVVIERYLWDDFYQPPRLFVGENTRRLFLPYLLYP